MHVGHVRDAPEPRRLPLRLPLLLQLLASSSSSYQSSSAPSSSATRAAGRRREGRGQTGERGRGSHQQEIAAHNAWKLTAQPFVRGR